MSAQAINRVAATGRPSQKGEPHNTDAAVMAIGGIDALSTLLGMLCEGSGLRFAVVAHVTETTWTACAVRDDIEFGIKPDDQLPLNATLCQESRAAQTPIVIEHASTDPRYRSHHAPKLYQVETYVTVPIIRDNGEYFGNLCGLDPKPIKVGEPRILSMFQRFAAFIAAQLDRQDQQAKGLLNERARNELREQFIAILGHDLRNPLQAVYATRTSPSTAKAPSRSTASLEITLTRPKKPRLRMRMLATK